MSNTATKKAKVIATEKVTQPKSPKAIQRDKVFVSFGKTNSTPNFKFILQCGKSFVNAEINRKQKESAMALLTDAQKQAYDAGAITNLKEFFTVNAIANFPAKNEFQTELATMQANFDKIAGKSLRNYTRALSALNEQRDAKTCFNEFYNDIKTHSANTWKFLLEA